MLCRAHRGSPTTNLKNCYFCVYFLIRSTLWHDWPLLLLQSIYIISVCSSNQKISAVNRQTKNRPAYTLCLHRQSNRPAFCCPSWGQHHSTWTRWEECTWPAKKREWCESKLPHVFNDFGLFGCKMLHCGITNGDDMHSPAGRVCEKGNRGMPHVACLATRPLEMAVLVDGPYNFRRHFSIASEQAPSWPLSLSCLESSEYIWIVSWHGIALRTVSGVNRYQWLRGIRRHEHELGIDQSYWEWAELFLERAHCRTRARTFRLAITNISTPSSNCAWDAQGLPTIAAILGTRNQKTEVNEIRSCRPEGMKISCWMLWRSRKYARVLLGLGIVNVRSSNVLTSIENLDLKLLPVSGRKIGSKSQNKLKARLEKLLKIQSRQVP